MQCECLAGNAGMVVWCGEKQGLVGVESHAARQLRHGWIRMEPGAAPAQGPSKEPALAARQQSRAKSCAPGSAGQAGTAAQRGGSAAPRAKRGSQVPLVQVLAAADRHHSGLQQVQGTAPVRLLARRHRGVCHERGPAAKRGGGHASRGGAGFAMVPPPQAALATGSGPKPQARG